MIDLRSDTVTQPTDAMRAAMASAEVGDDVFGEDPTLNRLQELSAEVTGKEAGLFVASGTMGNLLAVKCHTQPGDQAILERNSHMLHFEMGGMAWLSGVLPRALTSPGDSGILDPDDVAGALRSDPAYYLARTSVVCVENTHNLAGGTVYPLDTLAAIRRVAEAQGVPVHMDGARVFNAAVALGVPVRDICRHADTVSFCFSKGLSAPVGSMVVGPRDFIERVRRARRVVGGGMRQAGVLGAAAIVSLEQMVERLAEDHANARRLAEGLAETPGVSVDLQTVQTNIVICRLESRLGDCGALCERLQARGILVSQLASDSLRMVTHRHIGYNDVDRALAAFRESLPAS